MKTTRNPQKLLSLVLAVIMATLVAVPTSAAPSIYPDPLPEIDWSTPGLITNRNVDERGEIGRHLRIATKESILYSGYETKMDKVWYTYYENGYEPCGDQYLEYRHSGERTLPIIQPVYWEDKLVGEELIFVPRLDDFYYVSEYRVTNNDRGGKFGTGAGSERAQPGTLTAQPVNPTRTYDSDGNFEYDKYEHLFEYAYKISVAEFAAGYTAAKYAAGEPSPITSSPTPTENPSSWAVDAVNAAIAAKLVPAHLQSQYTQSTTRAEFCALAVALYENAKGEIAARNAFADTDDVNVEKAAAIGVVNGVGGGKFSPDATLTREQAATMLARLANAINKPLESYSASFADNKSASDWAMDAIGQMQASGVMGGIGGNRFDPKGEYTREQSIITIWRLFELLK